jgi:hypothetical protein
LPWSESSSFYNTWKELMFTSTSSQTKKHTITEIKPSGSVIRSDESVDCGEVEGTGIIGCIFTPLPVSEIWDSLGEVSLLCGIVLGAVRGREWELIPFWESQ